MATIREYLRAGLVDRLHLAIAPVLLGSGEALFEGIDLVALGYRCTEHAATEKATHVVLARGESVTKLASKISWNGNNRRLYIQDKATSSGEAW